MRTSLCLIGSELTRGIIQDMHTKILAPVLEGLGCKIVRVVIIPDDQHAAAVLRELSAASELIICTGGLGPTSDDVTRNAAAEAAGTDLVEDAQALAHLRQLINKPVGEANRRQVMIPRGFEPMQNPLGTAPGFCGYIGDTRLFCLPGPPAEMQRMLMHEVLPRLSRNQESLQQPLEASVFLIPESNLEELCQQACPPGIEWATRVQPLKISLYLRGSDGKLQEEAFLRLQRQAGLQRIRRGNTGAAESFIRTFAAAGKTCVFAESCTGGYLGKIITDIPGSSRVFWGSFVSYANEAKQSMLGVGADILDTSGAVSYEAAEAMASGALEQSRADVACAVTGIAGPEGGTDEKPVGTVWFSLAGRETEQVTFCMQWSYRRRDLIRRKAAVAALLAAEAYVNGEQVVDIVGQWQYS